MVKQNRYEAMCQTDGAMRTGNKVCKNQTTIVLEPGMWTEYRCVHLPQESIPRHYINRYNN